MTRAQQEIYQRLTRPFPQDFVDRTKLQKLCWFACLELDSVKEVFPEVQHRTDIDWKGGPVVDEFFQEMNLMIREGLIEETPELGSNRRLLRLSEAGGEWFARNVPQQAVERDLSNWPRLSNISKITAQSKAEYLKKIGSEGLRKRPDAKAHNWEVSNRVLCAFVMASSEELKHNGYVTPYFVAVTFGLPKSTVNANANRFLQAELLTRDPASVPYGLMYLKPTAEAVKIFESLRSRYEQGLLQKRNNIHRNKLADPYFIES